METEPHDMKLWGQQFPFERNHLQRAMTLTALVGILAVAVIVLIHASTADVVGVSVVCSGFLVLLAAMSRRRYAREAHRGFAILDRRGGGFVLGSAFLFAVVGVLVGMVVLLE